MKLIAVEPTKAGAMVALVVDGQLEDLMIDPDDDQPKAEEIHLVRVRRPIPGQGAAHVKLGVGKGFLREAKGVREGDLVPAQVSGYAESGKATPLTMRRLHRGRYAILSPGAAGVNVARSIKDPDERARLTAIAAPFASDTCGVILRSAAKGAEAEAIEEDLATLAEMEAAVTTQSAPGLLVEAPGAEITAWRDWGDPDELVREVGAFDRLGLWDGIREALGTRAPLPGGGWLSIEPTSALVAVDVNTGGDFSPTASAAANRAAATDLFRQLRLRGLGGQISVDFAPMRKSDRKAMEASLSKAIKADSIQTTFAGWTPLGMAEFTRKRERRPLTELLRDV